MMTAVKIRKYLDSEIIQIPVHKDMVGKDAEIIILTEFRQDKAEPKPRQSERKPGTAKGMITIADDFEAPLDDETVRDFYK